MSKDKPKVSIIIPVYNVEKYINRCLDSVLLQTFTDYQLILVNDGSTDGSLKICREYESLDSRIFVVDSSNRGSSTARNIGYSYATGEWIIYFDADDWIEPTMISELYEKAIEEDADIAACGFYQDDANGNKIQHLYPYHKIEPRTEIYRVDKHYSAVWNKLVKRELYEECNIHFLDGIRMWDDLAVTTRLRFHSKKTAILNKPLYHYFSAPRESISSTDIDKYPTSQLKVLEYLTDYFHSKYTLDSEIKKIINSLKITSKKSIFSINSEKHYNIWKNLNKDGNKYILLMKHLPLKNRVIMFIAANVSYKHLRQIRNLYKNLSLSSIHN